jgi:hypothetical protein
MMMVLHSCSVTTAIYFYQDNSYSKIPRGISHYVLRDLKICAKRYLID